VVRPYRDKSLLENGCFDAYTSAINAIIDALKLLGSEIHHRLHTSWIASIDFYSKRTIVGIGGMRFAAFCAC